MPLGFGLALLVLVGLGAVTQASIEDLVTAGAAVTRSLQALERLQAMKAVAREMEASELSVVLTGQRRPQESYAAAYAEILPIIGELRELLDSPQQRERLQQVGILTREVTHRFRTELGVTPESRPGAPGPLQDREALISDRLVEAIVAIEREERQVFGERQAMSASRARTAQSHVLVAAVLAFVTILIAGLMVRRDVLERRNVTDRLERANETLADTVAEAQRRREEITRLSRLSHFLQGCRSPEEACLVIEKTAPSLFGAAGALYLATGERFEQAAAWSDGHALRSAFSREACWGIRQGSIHDTDHLSAVPGCEHLAGTPDATCVPLVADGESFGSLVIIAPATVPEPLAARATLLAAVEQISVGLANLRLREALKIQSLRDPLTGLYNRRFLHDALSRECHDGRRHPDRPVSLMLMDLDFFKRVNDTSGHAAGDALLQALAQLLGRMFRGSDIACRFGGEEFAIILAETPLGAALRRAEALRLAIHGLHVHHGNTVLEGLTTSIGVTAGSGDAMTPEQLLEEADIALYEAKARGRDCCVPYSGAPGMRPLPFDMPPATPLV
jgi:diguanylate cyclase (GGDEF)-like protein